MWFEVKKTLFSTNCTLFLLLYPRLSETRWFLQSSSLWEARCTLIGQLSSALWLAEYLKHVTEMLRPLPYFDAVSPCDNTKKKNPIINEVFVASDGDIITYYNGVYCLFNPLCCMARHKLENELPGCESEVPDCPCKVGIAPLYRNSLWAQLAGSSQVQEIVRKMRCIHSNIWVELFWNSVVNTT